jgi:D-3-phosphoglycerate dehydrogenase
MFKVGITSDFFKVDGTKLYHDFDLAKLECEQGLELSIINTDKVVEGKSLNGINVLILLSPKFDETSIPQDNQLKLIARFGVGYDTVDLNICNKFGILVSNTPEAVKRPVAVSIITLILALTGNLIIKDKIVRKGKKGWDTRSNFMGIGLEKKTLGSLGFGNIAKEMFKLSSVFDMNFIAYDPYVNFNDNCNELNINVKKVDINDLFVQSDIVCINCDLNKTTKKLVNWSLLSQMKKKSFLINTARGGIVDQTALTEILKSKKIAGAGLDVFEVEPLNEDDPLLKLENVILTPHSLPWTDQLFKNIGDSVIDSVLKIKRGEVPSFIVNKF